MIPRSMSVQVVTPNIAEACAFYSENFGAVTTFDCGWYVVVSLGLAEDSPELCFMEPRDDAPPYCGGITVNLRFSDIDALHEILSDAGVTFTKPLADHPWGDRGFGMVDPSGLEVYCYQDTVPTDEYKQCVIPRIDP